MILSIIGYDPIGAWFKKVNTVEELLSCCNPAGITWINIEGLDDSAPILQLADCYHIHPLTVEDILDTEQRPKAEEFEKYIFISVKALKRRLDTASRGGAHTIEQISIIIMEDTLITFQELPGDSFDGIRKRILNNAGRVRRNCTDYLAYMILDVVVDDYFLILDDLGSNIEEFEERALDERDDAFLPDLQSVKQNLLRMRRVVWPLRESLSGLIHMDTSLIHPEMAPFFKDVHDNLMQAAETVETYRELTAGVMEISLSTMSNSMNSVMKVLTIISTIFIPLTFIVGVYGMNFQFMPELGTQYGYPITWAVMIGIAIIMLIIFKRRHWL
jgi:magnesium transporter